MTATGRIRAAMLGAVLAMSALVAPLASAGAPGDKPDLVLKLAGGNARVWLEATDARLDPHLSLAIYGGLASRRIAEDLARRGMAVMAPVTTGQRMGVAPDFQASLTMMTDQETAATLDRICQATGQDQALLARTQSVTARVKLFHAEIASHAQVLFKRCGQPAAHTLAMTWSYPALTDIYDLANRVGDEIAARLTP